MQFERSPGECHLSSPASWAVRPHPSSGLLNRLAGSVQPAFWYRGVVGQQRAAIASFLHLLVTTFVPPLLHRGVVGQQRGRQHGGCVGGVRFGRLVGMLFPLCAGTGVCLCVLTHLRRVWCPACVLLLSLSGAHCGARLRHRAPADRPEPHPDCGGRNHQQVRGEGEDYCVC